VPEALDEYDQYALRIVKLLLENRSASALVQYLLEVEIESMGLRGDHLRAQTVAQKLVEMGNR
jgi:hypothetical protein